MRDQVREALGEEEAWVVGGAVRDELLGIIRDEDIEAGLVGIGTAGRASPARLRRGKGHAGKSARKTVPHHYAGNITGPSVGHHNGVGVVLARNVPRLSVSYGNLEVNLERDSIRIDCAIIVPG